MSQWCLEWPLPSLHRSVSWLHCILWDCTIAYCISHISYSIFHIAYWSGQWWWYCKYIGKLIINNFTCFQLLANATRLYCQNWTMERCFCVLVVFGCFGAFACFGVFFCVLVRPLLIRCLLEYLSKIWLFNRVFLFCFCDSVLWIVMWCVMCKFLPNFALVQVAAVRWSRKSAYK